MKGGDDDDSDDDDDKRVVRGEKEKRTDQFKEIIGSIRKNLKSSDWTKVLTDIDRLIKQIERSKSAIAKYGNPPFVARIVMEVEAAQKRAEGTKEDRKKISKLHAKALSSIKQKVSKLLSTYKTEVEGIQKAEAAKAAAAEGNEDGGDDIDDDDDEDAEWQWGAVESKASPVAQDAPKTDENWSRDIVTQKLRELIAQRGKKSLDRFEQIRKLLELLSHADGIDQELAIWFNIIAAIFDTTTANTQMSRHYWTQAYRSLCTVVAILNDNKDLVLREATSDLTDVNVDSNVVTVVGSLVGLVTRLDDELTQSLQIVDPHSEQYILRLRDETKLVRLIERVQEYYERHNDNVIVSQVAVIRMAHLYAKREWVHKSLYDAEQYAIAHPEENTEPEKIDVADLRPTKAVMVDSDDEADDEEEDDSPEVVLVDVAEFKPIIVPARELPSRPLNYPYIDSRILLKSLAVVVFNHGDERTKTRAILYLIFHHALHDRFFEARDLLLMSHLQDNIHQVDVPTQILYNRALVQTGLCAFRVGLIHDAHNSLSEICSGGKIKELLAQGTSRHTDRSPEQERIEKSRQIPYHMHINLDLVECAHFISAMLLEVPNMAANAYDPKRKVISRAFRKLVDYFDRQTFSGPPDNTRESVVAAARALGTGNWRAAADYLLALRVWRFMPDNEEVKEMLRKKLKEEGLRTYLFAYGAYYSSFSLDELSETFDLPKSAIHSIVSKMMINDELRGSWDHPTSSIVMHNVEPSRLQALALQYTEKLATVVESNERVLDAKLGGYTGKYDTRVTKDSYSRGSDIRGSSNSNSSSNSNTSNNNRRYQRNDGNKRNDNRGGSNSGDRNDSDRRRTGGGNQRSNNRSSHKGQR